MARGKFTGRRSLDAKFRLLRIATRVELKRSLRGGALLIENEAVELIQQSVPSGNFYPSRGRKGSLHEASPAGAAPNADTGELHTSITSVERETADSFEITTGANTPYAAGLELGTSNMQPRPYMGPAFRLNLDRIDRNARGAMRRVVARIRKGS